MQSIRSRIILMLIRNRHLFQLKLKREIVDESFSIPTFREKISKASKKVERIPEDVMIEPLDIDGMTGEWIIPNGADQGKALMYIHGGGFISGNCDSHRMHAIKFAKGSKKRCLLFDYRLAPEYPFPAALDDCVKAVAWLRSNGFDDIVIGGESAGGTLTLTTVLSLKERGLPLPNAVFVISPVTDLSCSAKSFAINARKDIALLGSWDMWTKMYVGDNDVNTPLISPIYGDLSSLPPMLICVGTNEIHLDDAVGIAKKASECGVDVTLDKWHGMVHAFPIMSPLFPEAKREMEKICQFTREHLR